MGIACLLHAGAGSWIQLALLRFFMGGAEASATPANAKIIGEWFPKSERPVAAGWAGVGFLSVQCLHHQLLLCTCVIWLAGCIYVYRCTCNSLGFPLVGVL